MLIDEDDEDVSSKVDGSNNFTRFWLFTDDDSPILGCGDYANVTIYLEDGFPNSCSDVVAGYGGSCQYIVEDAEVWTGNGEGNNYTFNSSILSVAPVVLGYTNPPYLRFRNDSWQEAYPIEVTTGSNWANITGNTIGIDDGREAYYSLNIAGDTSYSSYVWLNNFYSSLATGSNVSFCSNGEGNFYEENLDKGYIEDVLDDCGVVNITAPNGGETYDKSSTSIIAINWTKQSSQNSISYYLYYSDDSGSSWDYIDSTSALTYDWDISSVPAGPDYLVKVIPYDANYNATNDQSNSTFIINEVLDNEWVCSDIYICEYQDITSALDGENNTGKTIYLIDPDTTYIVDKTVLYNISPAVNLPAINVSASNITLDCNHTGLIGASDGYGVYLEGQQNNIIKNCNLSNYYIGIYFDSSSNSVITNSVIKNNADDGIYLYDSPDNSITNNVVNNNSYGITLWYGSDSTNVINNTVNINNNYGIKISNANYNNISDNTLKDNNDTGIYILSVWGNNLTNNFMNDSNTGIYTEYLYYSNLINNTATNNNYGIYSFWITDNNFTYNVFNDNIIGNVIELQSKDNLLKENIFNNNGRGLLFQWGVEVGFGDTGAPFNNTLINNAFSYNDYEGFYLNSSSSNLFVNNTLIDNSRTGIFIVNGSDSNNITGNTLNNTATGYYDLRVNSSNSDGNIVWINNFDGNGVNDSGTNTIFCINGQGNYYGSGANRPIGECQIDVYNLSAVYSSGLFRIFRFKTKNIASQENSVNYTSLDTGESNINSSQGLNLDVGKEVFTFVDYTYSGSGCFDVTSYANSTLTDDQQEINVTV
jgi:parallel beta-helix repeat protein